MEIAQYPLVNLAGRLTLRPARVMYVGMKGAIPMATNAEFLIAGSREVRRVPRGWQHPKDEAGRLVPLLPFGYEFEDGQTPYPTTPDPGRDAAEIVAYETTTEGTPISPAFPDTPEGRLALIAWCAEHCTTFGRNKTDGEGWAALLFGDASVALDGRVIR